MSSLDRLLQYKVRVGRVYRVDVFLHWTLPAFAAYLLYTLSDDPKLGVLVVLALFASVFLHELGHCWGARQVGGDATSVVLWPLGGLAKLNVPLRPWPQFLSTATGPLVNVLIAALVLPAYLGIGGTLGALFGTPLPADVQLTLGFKLLFAVISLNGVLALFNIVPAFPMDGGRMLQAALWPRIGFHRAMSAAIYAALLCAGVMVLLAIFWLQSLLLGLVGIFVIQGALQERARLRYGIYDEELAMGSVTADVDGRPGMLARWRDERRRRREEAEAKRMSDLRARLDEVLAKVSAAGLDGLTADERAFLDKASRELRKQQQSAESS